MRHHQETGRYEEKDWGNFDLIRTMAEDWKFHQDWIINYDPHVVYYEQMCINPETILHQLLDAVGYDLVRDMEHVLKRFCSNSDYKDRCLKWQGDARFTKDHNDVICSEVGDLMESYGYLYNGHSDKLLQVEAK